MLVIFYLRKKNVLTKRQLYTLGWITLLGFPIPAFLLTYILNNTTLISFLELNEMDPAMIIIGLLTGVIYALFTMILLTFPVFKKIPLPFDQLFKRLKLNYVDAVFLSLCAGIGEELLFRAGVQQYLGIWPTAFIFVAIHGYFSIKTPLKSLYGLMVLPLSLLLGYGFESFGLWFSVAVHFSYDLALFISLLHSTETILPAEDA
jgi:hypothetical protein